MKNAAGGGVSLKGPINKSVNTGVGSKYMDNGPRGRKGLEYRPVRACMKIYIPYIMAYGGDKQDHNNPPWLPFKIKWIS